MNPTPDMRPNESGASYSPQPPAPEKQGNKVIDLLAAIAYPLIMFISQNAVVFAATVIITVLAIMGGVSEAEIDAHVLEQINIHINDILIAADLLIIAFLLIWFGCRGKSIPKSLEMNKVKPSTFFMSLAAGVGLTCALNYVMTWILPLFPSVMEDYNEHMSTGDGGSAISYLLAGVVLAPIVEELLFRALSLKHLDRVLPRWLATVLVAGLFGLVHADLVQGLYAGTLGILLCCLYFAYDSVLVPMALHFGFNLVSAVSLIDVESMNESQSLIFSMFYGLFSLIAVFGGIVALVFLLIRRTHPIWTKGHKESESVDAKAML